MKPVVTHSLALTALVLALPSLAVSAADLTELSLEALMDIQVTSVSKKPQKLANAAAAAFVISQDDIRRSGATTIPDLLRMVPGVQVARIDANKWAVSIRGFNGRFANKLLVLKDGRSIYTPLFSGVYWEHQETPLDDIERIEVIRGPGAALWGANAVNGVINIITRHAEETNGGLLSLQSGSQDAAAATARYGIKLHQGADLRVYGSYADHGPGRTTSGSDSHDAWQNGSAGFRLDSRLNSSDSLTLQGDYVAGSYDETYTLYNLTQPGSGQTTPSRATANGLNLLGRWQRSLNGSDSISVQLYYDHYRRSILELGETRDTVDLELQHRVSLGTRQDLIWGLGYRYTHDQLQNSPYIIFDKSSSGASLVSGFLHDEITLLPDRLALMLGARLEHNDYSGFELQPNARLLWTPSSRHSFWAAVSRAVRTPSRGDRDINYRFMTVPGPARLEINGSSSFRSESVIAYELGYRTSPSPRISVDMALFINQYDKLRVPLQAAPYAEATNLVLPYTLSNSMHGHTYGAELSLQWKPRDWWRLQASYSYLCSIMHLDAGADQNLAEINRADAAAGAPRHQGSLRSGFDLGRQVELDLWLRMVDRVAYIDQVSIPGYVTLDTRLSFRPSRQVELSLVGQNLLRSRHPEYIPEFINTMGSELPRSVYGKVTWRF